MPRPAPLPLSISLELDPESLPRRVAALREPALLESGPGFGDLGRWSYLAAEPRWTFEAVGDHWTLRGHGIPPESGTDPFDALERLVRVLARTHPGVEENTDLPPFLGGLIGFVGYDASPLLERLPRSAPRDSRLPDFRFGLYDTYVAVDHRAGSASLMAVDLLGDGRSTHPEQIERWRRNLGAPAAPPTPSRLGSPTSGFDPEVYRATVGRALEYIAAGDIFQANLSQRYEASGTVDPLDLHERLKARSPAPYAAFLSWDDLALISASPESFFEVRGRRIVTRPIKGTRPRSTDPAEDRRLASQLRASPKDRAELTMIVDLERNDLGRVCEYGSVVVAEPIAVESYAQVHHLVATVEGRLRSEVGPVAILRALFPGGSITGAPKIRAMEIIDALEPCRRSAYTGAIGWIGAGGDCGFNIAIRTLTAEGGVVRYGVGGGIVADSEPEAEYLETLAKGRGMREVIEGWGLPT